MKTLHLYIIACLASAVLLVSCDKADMTYTGESTAAPMDFTPVVGVPTKAILTGTTFPTSRTMVVSADLGADTGNAGVSYFTGVGFSYNSTDAVWKPTTGNYYWPLQGVLEILAYSAGSATVTPTWTKATNIRLVSTDFTADDVVVGGLTAATSTSKSIVYKHALCQMNARVKSSVASVIKVKSITVNAYKGATINGAKTAGSSDVTFTTSSLTGRANVSLFSGNQTVTTSFAAAGSGILLPAQTPASLTISYTITNNGVESPAMSVTKTLTTAMEPGKNYRLDINMTLTGITVTATLTDWVSGGTTNVSI